MLKIYRACPVVFSFIELIIKLFQVIIRNSAISIKGYYKTLGIVYIIKPPESFIHCHFPGHAHSPVRIVLNTCVMKQEPNRAVLVLLLPFSKFTYSIIIPESNLKVPKNILESYRRICGAVIKGLKYLWIESKYAPINDIIVNNKKISGSAQTRKSKTVLQHGTVLLDVDVDKMFKLLKVPNEKIKDKLIADVKQRVTSIKHISDNNVTFNETSDAMKLGFEEEFDIELVNGILTKEEISLTNKFERECFSTTEWNYKK